jgi:hypothetical protein
MLVPQILIYGGLKSVRSQKIHLAPGNITVTTWPNNDDASKTPVNLTLADGETKTIDFKNSCSKTGGYLTNCET